MVDERREYARIEVRLPLEIRRIPPEEKTILLSKKEELPFPTKLPPEVGDPALTAWLRLINTKLDTLLRLLENKNREEGATYLTAKNLGGGGISFVADEEYKPGEIVQIKIGSLPSYVPRYLYGEVVQSGKTEEGYRTGVKFIELDDATRDELIRFVFEKEREILRKSKE